MNLAVYFLKPVPDGDEKSIPQPLLQAFKILGAETSPIWISKDECYAIKEKKSRVTMFVNDFSTPEFQHLESTKNRIYGPFCAINCFQLGVGFPRFPHPVFCMSMNNLTICCTGVPTEQRNKCFKLVKYMGGKVDKQFNDNVTHLVAADTGSQKYLVAGQMGVPIMLPEWIDAVWKESQKRICAATEEQFSHLRTPVFYKAVITLSGFDLSERARYKLLIEDAGGRFSGQMIAKECTHLVTSEPRGKKYTFAVKWKGILIVSPQWLHDSVERGYRLDETLYTVGPDKSKATSTPTKDRASLHSLTDISCIDSSNMSAVSAIDETTDASMEMAKPLTSFTRRPSSSDLKPELIELKNLDLNSPEVQSHEMFLDGCKIYVVGFSQQDSEKVKKIINLGGATRYSNINECVTHVIMGERIQSDLDLIIKESFEPKVVTLSWLLESLQQGHPVDEIPFRFEKATSDQKIDIPKKKMDVKPKQNEKDPFPKPNQLENNQDDMNDILSQYLGDPERQLDDPDHDMTAPPVPDNNSQLVDNTMETTYWALPFKDKEFILFGLDTDVEHLKEIITEMGGKLVQSVVRHVVDYAVVPLFGYPVNITVGEVVSTAWIDRCIEEQALLSVDDHVLYRPLTLAADAQPLTGCVVTISGFVGSFRNCLHQIAESLGACVQDHLAHKAKSEQALKASTHLLVNIPAGIGSSKYKAAVKWKIQIVREEWLYECAKTGRKIAEDKYSVDTTTAAAAASNMNTSTSSATNTPTSNKRNIAITPTSTNRIPTDRESLPLQSPRDLNIPPKTPKLINQRVQALMASAESLTPKPNHNLVSPGQFLNPDKPFIPNFDCAAFLDAIKTPVNAVRQAGQLKRRNSTPIAELISRNLAKGVENMAKGGLQLDQALVGGAEDDVEQNTRNSEDNDLNKPLAGVVIYVSKKLQAKQAEYHNIAGPLGADYRWTYDSSVTHLLYQGRGTDKEYKTAKQQKKFIISPYWLLLCKDMNSKVEEALFPHNYNPKMSLSVSTPTPTGRSTRRSVRNSSTTGDSNQEETTSKSNSSEDERTPAAAATPAPSANNIDINEESEPIQNATKENVEETSMTVSESSKVLCKQMEDLINATKGQKPERRKSRRLNSFGQLNASSSNESNVSNESKSTRSKFVKHTSKEEIVENIAPPDTQCEASQSLEVMWDDPTGRLEREKMADELERAYNPTQPNDFQFQPVFPSNADNVPIDQPLDAQNDHQADRTVTPEPPSLTFPRPKSTNIPPPQPIELIDDGDDLNEEEGMKLKTNPVFLLSGISVEERTVYGALIEQLGGICSDSQHFDTKSTHLVIEVPTRNEKVLASIASGKWVLHKSYFQACKLAGHFVDESEHEWGSISTEGMTGLSKLSLDLASAAHRWRLRVEQHHEGAFCGWSVVFCCTPHKVTGFKRLIEAGGGTVLATRPPYSSPNVLESCTHAFIETKSKTEFPVNEFVKAGIDCLKPEYIGAFLVNEPTPNSFYINQVAASVMRHPNHKRKGSDTLVLSNEAKKMKVNCN
ncbi:DNA topoisomerase 2-binding protein 1-like isoform X2 [Tubulanus polymorphus]|uniref:DNA topoisomerase 2-binding protein 1-like isoform X2 n=1 Tax=Tubulanus polymorphus TaxID=672921 RepID=UPI003DA67259